MLLWTLNVSQGILYRTNGSVLWDLGPFIKGKRYICYFATYKQKTSLHWLIVTYFCFEVMEPYYPLLLKPLYRFSCLSLPLLLFFLLLIPQIRVSGWYSPDSYLTFENQRVVMTEPPPTGINN